MPWELDPVVTGDGGTLRRLERWSVVVPATSRPVTWAEVKAHLHLNSDTEQSHCETLIDAATDYAERKMECSLMQRTLLATFYDKERLILPRGPLIEIVSILDRDDTTLTEYELKHAGRSTQLVLTRAVNYPVSITYKAGHTTANAIPASIRLAIMSHVGTLYENRESVSDKSKMPVPHSLDEFYRLNGRGTGIG